MASCSVCKHPDREAIDKALLAGVTLRELTEKYGSGRSSLDRHKRTHIPLALIKAVEAADEKSLLQRLVELNCITRSLLAETRTKGNIDLSLKAIQRLEKQMELEARLLGELNMAPSTTVNVAVVPEWMALRTRILRALDPYPEARMAVILAIGNG